MQVATLVSALLLNFANPNLCADVYLDEIGEPIADSWGQMLSRHCQWAGPNAPVLDSDVCCTIDQDGAHCSLPDDSGRCALGFKMYCEHGAVSGGGVTCMQPFPSACDHGLCKDSLNVQPQGVEQLVCCGEQGCEPISGMQALACEAMGAVFFWCDYGVTNTDGTVECFDE
ncbi:MAG: hypothetical protein KC431_09605 [Myxococcales bacterium]|nr:hypothetical protein [Myxococcales bacterium]